MTARETSWPPLPLAAWADTCATLHMWTQIVGKIRLARAPRVNHWWHVTLYVTARGLTRSPIPYHDDSDAAADLAKWNRAELEVTT